VQASKLQKCGQPPLRGACSCASTPASCSLQARCGPYNPMPHTSAGLLPTACVPAQLHCKGCQRYRQVCQQMQQLLQCGTCQGTRAQAGSYVRQCQVAVWLQEWVATCGIAGQCAMAVCHSKLCLYRSSSHIPGQLEAIEDESIHTHVPQVVVVAVSKHHSWC
jgi:hypothetical protein